MAKRITKATMKKKLKDAYWFLEQAGDEMQVLSERNPREGWQHGFFTEVGNEYDDLQEELGDVLDHLAKLMGAADKI